MAEFRVLTWQQHVAISGDYFSLMMAKQLLRDDYPARYEPTQDDVDQFLTPDLVRDAFWERLSGARDVSIQWGDGVGTILAVAGFGIDTEKWEAELSEERPSQRQELVGLMRRIDTLLFPVLDAMA